jgi:hypothetical protein
MPGENDEVNELVSASQRTILFLLFAAVQPDVIVSIHPMLNHVTIHALRELGLPIPFITFSLRLANQASGRPCDDANAEAPSRLACSLMRAYGYYVIAYRA